MADVKLFTQDPRVVAAIKDVKQKCAGKYLSDIIDDADHQYVDLVMEGGGVLGIALTGYTYVLEQAGIRFLGIGGTSAGSINALMIAALGKPADAKSEKLVNVLASIPMASFIDGDADARDFSQAVLEKAGMIKLLWKAAQVMDNLKEELGLNPGQAFFNWLTSELKATGIQTNADLQNNLAATPPGLRIRDGRPLASEEKCGRLAMVAADITTETKVEFPKMAELYWSDPDHINPACFARASMSIPFFFHPYRVDDCPQNKEAWEKHAGYSGTLPTSVMFMDGGIMSNFPINLFHEPYRVPLAPTFGAKIGIDRAQPTVIATPSQLVGAVFNAARHTLDFDFIMQNPDYRHLVTMINTGTHNWLNFTMGDADKVDLFARGARAAADFLCGFDWPKYKEIRQDIANAFQASRNNTA
jgi:NTE family protein